MVIKSTGQMCKAGANGCASNIIGVLSGPATTSGDGARFRTAIARQCRHCGLRRIE